MVKAIKPKILIAIIVAPLAFFDLQARAAELTAAIIRMDFIIGGKHAPWFVALEKGFYSKRGLQAKIQSTMGSADTVRTMAAGGADFGFADIGTMIVARSRGAAVQVGAQFGYLPATVLWREDTDIKSVWDLKGKSYTNNPEQSLWFLMPAYCRINKLDCKSLRLREMAAALQPAALVAKKVDFILAYRASNDEVAELAAVKQGIKLRRMFMKDNGLDIYGSGLIVKDIDINNRPEFVRAYIEGTLEGLRYAQDRPEDSLKILFKNKPELDRALTTMQLKNALAEVFIPLESTQVSLGHMIPEVMGKTVKVVNEYFDISRRIAVREVYSNQFIKR